MRELKFRAWVLLDNGCSEDDPAHYTEMAMLDVAHLGFDSDGIRDVTVIDDVFRDSEHVEYDIDDVELLQWTGLCDRNGTEIYNLDILKLNDLDLLVVYRFGGYDLTCINPQTWSSPYFYGSKDKLERVCCLFEYKDPIHIKPVVLEVLPELGVLNNFVNPELLEGE